MAGVAVAVALLPALGPKIYVGKVIAWTELTVNNRKEIELRESARDTVFSFLFFFLHLFIFICSLFC